MQPQNPGDGSPRPDDPAWAWRPQGGTADAFPAEPARGGTADWAHGAWASAPGTPQPSAPTSPPPAPTTGGTYGKASVPLNTVRPTSPAAAPPAETVPAWGFQEPVGPAGFAVPPAPGEQAAQPGSGGTGATGDGARSEQAGSVGESRTVKGRKLVALLAVIVVVIVGVAVVGLVQPGPVKGLLAGEESKAPTTAVPPDPAPTAILQAASGGQQPDPAKVKVALDPLVNSAALGDNVHVSVLDVASGSVLYAQDADVPTTPASTTKLLTAATVLASYGPAHRFSTTAVAGPEPGEVVLVGGGDPTLSVDAKAEFPGSARLDQLAAQVKKALGGTKPTRVLVDTSLFTGPETGLGWSSDDVSPLGQVARVQPLMTNAGRVKPVHNESGGDPRFADPAVAAGKAFAKLLGAPTSGVKRGTAPATPSSAASAPATGDIAPGTRLGVVRSAPLVQITDWMLEQSDNTIAEVMGRQVAVAAGKEASFDGASEAIVAKLSSWGLPGDEADLYDASGLSRHDGISPTLLVQLLSLAASGKQPAITGMFGGLPVAGWSGTLEKRFGTPKANRAGQGVVRAKTGTLSGVNTMAGELITKDGRLLVFAMMASGSSSATAAKAALDKVPARLVACGC